MAKTMTKMKRLIALYLVILSGTLESVLGDPLTYKIEGDTVTVVDCDKDAAGELIIPSKYEGLPVTTIGNRAFQQCWNITSIIIPQSVNLIKGGANFSDCRNLKSINLPEGLRSINDIMFQGCISLEKLIIPNNVLAIKDGAFSFCKSLKTIIIPNKVELIGEHAFAYSGISSIKIPSNVHSIQYQAFADCLNLNNIEFAYPARLFSAHGGGANMFVNCKALESVTIPQISEIPRNMFAGCTNLKIVNIMEGTSRILWGAFSRCESLEKIILPKSISKIYGGAFDECYNLKELIFLGEKPWVSDYIGDMSPDANIIIMPSAKNFSKTFQGYPVLLSDKNPIKIEPPELTSYRGFLAFEITIDSKAVGMPHLIQFSPDNKTWKTLKTLTLYQATTLYLDKTGVGNPKRFYRVKLKE